MLKLIFDKWISCTIDSVTINCTILLVFLQKSVVSLEINHDYVTIRTEDAESIEILSAIGICFGQLLCA